MTLADLNALADAIRTEIAKAVVGMEDAVDLMLVSLFTGGHLLLEGPPGTAKTLLARSFAAALDLDFSRIQFTPDLMPGDVIGANIFDFKSSAFRLTKGPIFTELLLADEINRTPPKTQAALLEAMQERTVTIDGQRHELGERFVVVATQNPIEQQGTYPLPEAQLDRFLFKHVLDYPSEADEIAMVERTPHTPAHDATRAIRPVADGPVIAEAVALAQSTAVSEPISRYAVAIIRATREAPAFSVGASPRAAVMLCAAARTRAALDARDYVIPDDVKSLARPALRHRVSLSPAAEIEGRAAEDALIEVVNQIDAPR